MKKLKLHTLFIFLLIPLFLSCDPLETIDNAQNSIIPLSKWQYHEEIEIDSSDSQQTEISKILAEKDWKTFNILNKLPENYNKEYIWIKTTLPKWESENSALYVGQVNYSMKAFLNNKMIYQWGSFSSSTNKYIRWHQNLITLPYYENGSEILFKIRLGNEFDKIVKTVLYGSSTEIIKDIVRENISNTFFSIVFFITGLIALILYFNIKSKKLLLGISFFLFPMGTFILVNTQTAQLIFNSPALFYHLNYISVTLVAFGVYFTLEQVVIDKYKPIIKILWILPIVFLVFTILVDTMTNLIFYDLLKIRLAITIISMIICLYIFFKSRNDKSYEKRIFVFGVSAYFISVIFELIILKNIGLQGDFGYNVRSMQYGAFLFVVSVVWGAVNTYIENRQQKEKLQELEIENMKRKNEERYYFTSKLIELQENERSRIALELHDSVGQNLILIKNQLLSKIKNSTDIHLNNLLHSVSELTGDTINEVRTITHNLRPQFLDQLGLKAAIEFMVDQISEHSDIEFSIYVYDVDELIPDKDKINFFRIVQESLNNIVKHSSASEAFVKITCDDAFINLEIKDNGIGLEQNADSLTLGIGLTGMKERAEKIGADLEFTTNNSGGTTIKMKYKLNRETNI